MVRTAGGIWIFSDGLPGAGEADFIWRSKRRANLRQAIISNSRRVKTTARRSTRSLTSGFQPGTRKGTESGSLNQRYFEYVDIGCRFKPKSCGFSPIIAAAKNFGTYLKFSD